MSSQLQIEANRRNSQKSTGPRSPEGKAVSRFNALKSGIHAAAQVIPGEDPAELELLSSYYHRQWQPATPLETFLVDTLVRADWQLRRLCRLEAQLWTTQMSQLQDSSAALHDDSPLGEVYHRSLDAFTRLQRRIDSTERSYYRALTQLQRLRRDSLPAPDPEPPSPPEAPALASFSDVSRYNPPLESHGRSEDLDPRSPGLPQAGHPVL